MNLYQTIKIKKFTFQSGDIQIAKFDFSEDKQNNLHSNLVIFKSIAILNTTILTTEFTFQSGDIQIRI